MNVSVSFGILPAPNHRGGSMKLLLADDDPSFRSLLGKTLTSWGYQVSCAADATAKSDNANAIVSRIVIGD